MYIYIHSGLYMHAYGIIFPMILGLLISFLCRWMQRSKQFALGESLDSTNIPGYVNSNKRDFVYKFEQQSELRLSKFAE